MDKPSDAAARAMWIADVARALSEPVASILGRLVLAGLPEIEARMIVRDGFDRAMVQQK